MAVLESAIQPPLVSCKSSCASRRAVVPAGATNVSRRRHGAAIVHERLHLARAIANACTSESRAELHSNPNSSSTARRAAPRVARRRTPPPPAPINRSTRGGPQHGRQSTKEPEVPFPFLDAQMCGAHFGRHGVLRVRQRQSVPRGQNAREKATAAPRAEDAREGTGRPRSGSDAV